MKKKKDWNTKKKSVRSEKRPWHRRPDDDYPSLLCRIKQLAG